MIIWNKSSCFYYDLIIADSNSASHMIFVTSNKQYKCVRLGNHDWETPIITATLLISQ